MRVLAVDFGTSNTVAALGVDGGAPRLVAIDGSPLLPSSVFRTEDGSLAVGRDADRQARLDPSRFEPNPKRRIDDGELLLGDAPVPVVSAIAAVLRRVAGEVGRQLGGPPDQVRLTHPARWGRRRRDTLLAASREAGLAADPVLVPEPVAAATHFATLSGHGLADGGALAVYDLGGGTFDAAVVQRRGGAYEVLAEAGLPDLGGLDFDQAVLDHIGRSHGTGPHRDEWLRLLAPTDPAARRAARAMVTDIRDGKEALSRHPHVDIALPPPFADVHLTRSEFEDLVRAQLQRSVELVGATIAEAGTTPDRLAGVYLVGGSSRIPLVARLIQEGLGVTPTTLDQPETSVATGALYLPVGAATPAARGPVAGAAGPYASAPQPAVRPAFGTGTGPVPVPGPLAAGSGAAPAATGVRPRGAGSAPVPGVPPVTGPTSGAHPALGAQRAGPAGPVAGSRPAGPLGALGPPGPGSRPAGPPPAAARHPGPAPGAQAGAGGGPAPGSGPTGPASGAHPAAGRQQAGPAPGAHRTGGAPGPVPGAHPAGAPAPGSRPAGPVPGAPRAGGPPPAAPRATVPGSGPHPAGPGPAGGQALGIPRAPGPPAARGAGPAPAAPPGAGPRPPVPAPPPGTRPYPPPGPATPPYPPSAGGSPRRRPRLVAAAGVVALLLAVAGIVALNAGGGGGGGASGPLAAPTTPSTEFDAFFSTVKLRDYARPYYAEMASCTQQSTGGAAAAQCKFDDGHEVLLFEIPGAASLDVWRTTLGNTAQLQGADKGTWARGAKWTVQKPGGSALYWDAETDRLGGLAVKQDESLPDLDAWWSARFGRS